jgi:hypothetical protein
MGFCRDTQIVEYQLNQDHRTEGYVWVLTQGEMD